MEGLKMRCANICPIEEHRKICRSTCVSFGPRQWLLVGPFADVTVEAAWRNTTRRIRQYGAREGDSEGISERIAQLQLVGDRRVANTEWRSTVAWRTVVMKVAMFAF